MLCPKKINRITKLNKVRHFHHICYVFQRENTHFSHSVNEKSYSRTATFVFRNVHTLKYIDIMS